MRVKGSEVEFAGDQEDHSSDSGQPTITSRFAFGGLEQSVECFQEAVGHARSRPGDDALQVIANHPGDRLHRLDRRARHVSAPLPEHDAHNIDLFAADDLTQVLAVLPGTGRAFGGELGQQGIKIDLAGLAEAAAVFQQRPAQPLEGPIPPSPESLPWRRPTAQAFEADVRVIPEPVLLVALVFSIELLIHLQPTHRSRSRDTTGSPS